MRVPNKSAQPAGPLPGTGYQALRHETLLDAPKREEASFAPFTAPLKNTAAILDGIDSLADAGRKIAARLQEERDDAAARDALVTLNKAYDAYAWGDEGTDGEGTGGVSLREAVSKGEYGRKGREAFDAVVRGREWFEKETARLAKNLNDNAARKFREHSAQLRVSVLPGLARHEAAERRAYALQSLEAHRDIEHRNAVANFTDPVRYNQFVAHKAGIELQRAMKLGLPQDEALLAVKESVSETLAGVFENQVRAGEFSLAQTLYRDARISGDKKVMLADAYRRARLRHELDSARADPESARSRLGELRKETRGRGSASPLDFTEEDFAALENQIAASEKRREAEKIQRVDRITGGFEGAFALAVKTGDFSRVLEAEEALLALGREDIAEKSKRMREMHTAIRPLLEAAKGMPFHDREAAEETAFAQLAETWGEEAAAPLRAMCSGELEREKTRALKDPAAYAAGTLQAEGNAGTGGAREDLPTANLGKEAAAIENMAAQAALFKGVEGFTPKVLTAAEAAKAKSVLAEEKTPNAAKLLSLVRLHESYGSLGETALDELELAPAVRAAVDLAIQDPRQEAFAAGLLGAASLPGKQKDEAANRLALLAGTNPKAKAILLRFAGQDAPAPPEAAQDGPLPGASQDGPLPGAAQSPDGAAQDKASPGATQSPDADSGKDPAAADGEAVDEMTNALMEGHERLTDAPSALDGGTLVAGPFMPALKGKSESLGREELIDGNPYNAKIEALYNAMDALPQDQWEMKASRQPFKARLILAAMLDADKIKTDETLQRRLLVLSGVPLSAVKKAFEPTPGLSRADQLYQFRQNITFDMLPEQMRDPTRKMIGAMTNWLKKNKSTLGALEKEWRKADTAPKRKKVLHRLFDALRTDLVPNETKMEKPEKESRAPIVYDVETDTILVDENHMAFTDVSGPEALLPQHFERVVAVLMHEIAHSHQRPHLMEQKRENVAMAANPITVNGLRLIPFDGDAENNRPYVLQPIELQAHLVQNEVLRFFTRP